MKLIDKIMDALSLYDEEDDLLDEELEVKKPLAKENAPEKVERPSLFRKKEVSPAPKPEPVKMPEPVVPEAKEKKSFLSFKSPKAATPVAKPERIRKSQLREEICAMADNRLVAECPIECAIKTMPHAMIKTTVVRMAVAKLASTCSIPILAKMAVAAAKTADEIAKNNHICFMLLMID